MRNIKEIYEELRNHPDFVINSGIFWDKDEIFNQFYSDVTEVWELPTHTLAKLFNIWWNENSEQMRKYPEAYLERGEFYHSLNFNFVDWMEESKLADMKTLLSL